MKPKIHRLAAAGLIRFACTTPIAVATLAATCGTATAQLTWSASGSTNNWSTATGNENWNPGGVVWTQNQNAVFDITSGTPEAIDVTTANIFNDITFDVSGFSITSTGAGSLTLGNDLASTITVTTAGHTASIAETIANSANGPSTLTKAGAGTLILDGTAASTWSGGTVISAGTLSSNQGSNIALLGTGPVSIASGATLNLTNTSITADSDINNNLSGPGSITTTSATRAIVLRGDLSGFTGSLAVSTTAAGKISYSPSVPISSSASVSVASGATLFIPSRTISCPISVEGTGNTENRGAIRIDTGSVVSGNIALNADSSIGNSGTSSSTISGIISGGFGIRGATTGNQPVILSGLNTYTGRTTLAGGNAFSVATINNAGNPGNLGTNGTIDFGITTTGGTLIYTGTGETTDRVINLAGTTGGGAITQSGTGLLKFTSNLTATGGGAKTLTLNGSTAGSGEIAGVVVDSTGTTGITKQGTGTWILSGSNTFTGNVRVEAGGALRVTNNNALGSSVTGNTTVVGNAGGTGRLELSGNITTPEPIVLEARQQGSTNLPAVSNAGGNNTISGIISGTTGGATYNIESASGTLTLSGGFTLSPSATGTGRILQLQGASDGIVSGVISNAASGSPLGRPAVVKQGAGTWTLSATNTFTNTTTITGGILKLDYSTNDTTKLSNTDALIGNGGTLELAGGAHAEIVGSTTLNAGTASTITTSGVRTAPIHLNAVSAGVGSKLTMTANSIATTDSTNINGILPWARVLVAGAPTIAFNSTNGADGPITAYTHSPGEIVTRLSGVIPNGIANNVRIVNGGTPGDVTLSSAPLNHINFLQMDSSDGGSVVNPAASTDVFMIGDETGGTIWQTATSGPLTIGATANDGILTTGNIANSSTSLLNFVNDSSSPIIVNSAITDNGTDPIRVGSGGVGGLILNGNNTFTGTLTVASGRVTLAGNNSARPATASGQTVIPNGTFLQLQANPGNTTAGVSSALSADRPGGSPSSLQPLTLSNGGTLELRSDDDATFSGTDAIGGLGSANVTIDVNRLTAGTGRTLGIAPGGFDVNTTTINVTGGNGCVLATGPINNVASGGVLTLNPTTASVEVNGYTASPTFATTLTLGGTSAGNEVTGAIINPATSGATSVTKTGTSIWTLSGANNYSGTTSIAGGTLIAGSPTACGVGGTLTMSGTGILDLNGNNITFANWTNGINTATVTDNAAGTGTSIITVTAQTNTMSNLVSDGPTRKVSVAVANANTNVNILNNVGNTFSGDFILKHSTAGTRLSPVTLANGGVTGSPGSITSGPYGRGAIIVGESTSDKAGIYIAGANTTIVNAIAMNTTLGTDRPGIRVDAAGTVLAGELKGDLSDVLFSTNGTGSVTVTGKVTSGASTTGLVTSDAFGTSITVILANSGPSNDYSGNTTIGTKGILRLGAANQVPDGATAGNVTISGQFQLDGFNETVNGLNGSGTVNSASGTPSLAIGANDASGSFSGTVSGTLALTKTGSGIQTLAGPNTYAGGTSVQGGTLLVNGNQSAATGPVAVASSATLGGNGILGGAVSIASGGTIAPGTSTGNLTVASAAFAAGSTLAIEIDDSSTPKADRLSSTGALNISGAALAVSVTGTASQGAYVIASYPAGQLTGTFASTTGIPSGYTLDYAWAGGTQIALVTPYGSWAAAKGLTAGVNDGPNDDPDGDGRTNKVEFAFDGNPLSGSADGKVVGKTANVGGNLHMTLTMPVRAGAVFSDASGPEVSALINGLIYRIEGSDTLASWTLNVSEVTGPDAAAIQAGLPGLSDINADTIPDWTYRTFRAPNPVSGTNPADFLRAGAE